MNVYVATKWENKDGARAAMATMRAAGHTITHDWTAVEEAGANLAECAIDDVDGVERADVLLLIPHAGIKGAWVEMGVAIANFIPVLIIDNPWARKCIFEHLPGVVHVADVEAAIAWLAEYQGQLAGTPKA